MTSSERDLSALTRKRSSGLAGKLGAPAERPAPAAVSNPPPEPTEEQPPALEQVVEEPTPPPPRRRTSRKPVEQGPKTEESWRKRSWPVYLPGPVRQAITETKGGRSNGEWFLDAFEAVNEQLPDRFPDAAARRAAGLPPRTPRPRSGVEDPKETPLRLTGEEIAVVEARRVELGSPNRSEYATVIAELYIDQLRHR